MIKHTNLAMMALSGFLLSACVIGPSGPPTKEELASADYGSYVTQYEARRKAKEFFADYLKDPYSAQYQWGTIEKGWIREAPISGGNLIFGYILRVNVNAKNSYGAYIGYKPYVFIFYDSSIKNAYVQHGIGNNIYLEKIY